MIATLPYTSRLADADFALLALAAEQVFSTDSTSLQPKFDPKFGSWQVEGWITGVDAVFKLGRLAILPREVFYGWLLRKGSFYVIAIRGTGDPMEWWIDALWMLRRAHPYAGRVETGFWSVYESLKLNGTAIATALQHFTWEQPLTVVGHSLGAALSTYLTFDLAKAFGKDKVQGVFIASPHPGDKTFAKAFGEMAPQHIMYRNVRDIVPRVPLSIPFIADYSAVPNVQKLSANKAGLEITGGFAAQHHVLTYFALMEPNLLTELRQRFGAAVSYIK
jgi:alpha-beta hydrolase superfamily lysophospholipase